MEKEFIPYQESLALKELEFDEPCIRGWDESKKIWYHPDSDIAVDNPTFSQAFRWFRDNHKLHHKISMFGDWDKPQYSYIVSGRTMWSPVHMWYYKNADSYEEAELACLRKLIEIIKSQKNGNN